MFIDVTWLFAVYTTLVIPDGDSDSDYFRSAHSHEYIEHIFSKIEYWRNCALFLSLMLFHHRSSYLIV